MYLETTLWRYRANIVNWIDGDTADVDIDLGFRIHTFQRLRLLGSSFGIDAYEMHDKDDRKRAIAQAGRTRVRELLPAGAPCYLITDTAKGNDPKDSFGRYLSRVLTMNGKDIGQILLNEGLAIPYIRGK